VLALAQHDEALADVEALAAELAGVGADVLIAGTEVPGVRALPAVGAHPAIEPLLLIQSFYRLANALALARGRDPDRPPHLRKVTETV
jgi:glucosamine--fructose-6-phosphate aminotransferase (isomerizing)